MSNQGIHGWPRRREQAYTRRAFNVDYAPRFNDLVAWYDMATDVYSDVEGTTLAVPGDGAALIKDQSQYGRHMYQATSGYRPGYSVDAGYFAISTGNNAAKRHMRTVAPFAAYMSIVVFRGPGTGWDYYSTVTGRASSDIRPYLFANSGTGFNDSPSTFTRRNNVALGNDGGLAAIENPLVLSLDHKTPAQVDTWLLGGHWGNVTPTYGGSLVIYEVMMFSSLLPTDDISDIEQMLMAKYSVV